VTFEFGGDVSDLEKTRRGGGGILTYTVDQVERVDSRHDLLAFGLRTRQTSDATLVHVTSDNSNDYIRLEMVSLRSFILTYLLTYLLQILRYRPLYASLFTRQLFAFQRVRQSVKVLRVARRSNRSFHRCS